MSADGVSWPYLAAATLDGDVLAAAHVDALDPSAPTIVIQLATKGGALGPAIAIRRTRRG